VNILTNNINDATNKLLDIRKNCMFKKYGWSTTYQKLEKLLYELIETHSTKRV